MNRTNATCVAVMVATAAAGFFAIKWVDDHFAERRAKEAEELAEKVKVWKVPYKISEADGCEVYTFNPDGLRWRYFTKCGSATTTTDNTWVECSGSKANTCVARSEPLSVKGK